MKDEMKGIKMNLTIIVKIRINRAILPTGRTGRNSSHERYTLRIELWVNRLTN